MEAVETAVVAAIGDAQALVTTSIPLIVGIAVAFVGIRIAKRVLGKL